MDCAGIARMISLLISAWKRRLILLRKRREAGRQSMDICIRFIHKITFLYKITTVYAYFLTKS